MDSRMEREERANVENIMGKQVRDVRLIMDRNSRQSKGVGYVELYDAMSVPMAIALSGCLLFGQPVVVKPSEAEKNLVQSTTSGAGSGLAGLNAASERTLCRKSSFQVVFSPQECLNPKQSYLCIISGTCICQSRVSSNFIGFFRDMVNCTSYTFHQVGNFLQPLNSYFIWLGPTTNILDKHKIVRLHNQFFYMWLYFLAHLFNPSVKASILSCICLTQASRKESATCRKVDCGVG